MKLTAQIQNLLDQEMDRAEFLRYAGAATLAVLGVTSIIKSLEGLVGGNSQQKVSTNMGYGGGSYGGTKHLG